MQTVVDGPYAGDYYAMDGTYGTQTTAVTGGCLYRYRVSQKNALSEPASIALAEDCEFLATCTPFLSRN